jgi:intracellular multiplication protein IcmP
MPPQPHPRASWPSADDQAVFNLIVIIAGMGVGSYLLWTNFHGEISAAVIALRHQEMLALGLLTDRFSVADAQMMAANPYRVTLRDLHKISSAIGTAWRIPACAFIVLLAGICAVRAAPSRYRRNFDLAALSREQALTFRSAAAFLNRKLSLVSPSDGEPRPADYALTAEEWIGRYALDRRGTYDETRARNALIQQLGPSWTGPERATPVVQLLFVAFALHLAERREDTIHLLGLASSALSEGDDGDGKGPEVPLSIPPETQAAIAPLLKDRQTLAGAVEVAAAHAFTNPALMSLLNAARVRHGVLAPAQFTWLKLVDRPLWYALHSLGFETDGIGRYVHPNPRVEALGARDHWAVECAAGSPVHEPDVSRALMALRRHALRATALPIARHRSHATGPVPSTSNQARHEPISPGDRS